MIDSVLQRIAREADAMRQADNNDRAALARNEDVD
jgi:hypothetical protein